MNWMILPYRRYFDFMGRSRRKEFWAFAGLYLLVTIAIAALFGHTTDYVRGPMSISVNRSLTPLGNVISTVFGLASLVPSFAVAVRRLHDQNRTGWLMLLALIPFFGWFALLVLMLLDGSPGDNLYGPDPKGRGTVDVFR
ncbi:MAG: DUF805 domain-containing protein [Sphingomonadales bacterium]|nr:DUF805 domain-containing protein [Sphingomonadales bacterium]MDE2567497.1 DUF805 domain-containing protein [Sphingomonadales bacterium]